MDPDGNRMGVYVSMRQNITQMRGLARSGLCLPIECVQSTINNFTDNTIDLLNSALAILPTFGINLDLLIFNN